MAGDLSSLVGKRHAGGAVTGFPDSEVSEYGHVRRSILSRGGRNHAQLRSWVIDGYEHVNLRGADGQQHRRSVHRLVCIAFHGPPKSDKPMVCHKDAAKLNNHESNLYWGDAQDNADDKDPGRFKTAPERWGDRKLTKSEKDRPQVPD